MLGKTETISSDENGEYFLSKEEYRERRSFGDNKTGNNFNMPPLRIVQNDVYCQKQQKMSNKSPYSSEICIFPFTVESGNWKSDNSDAAYSINEIQHSTSRGRGRIFNCGRRYFRETSVILTCLPSTGIKEAAVDVTV